VLEAVHHVHHVHQGDGGGYFRTSSRTIAEIIMESSEATENIEETRASLVKRVGKVLKPLRFKNEGQPKRGKPREWRIYESALESAIAPHGLLHLKNEKSLDALDATHKNAITTTASRDTSSGSCETHPSDTLDANDALDETMRMNKNNKFRDAPHSEDSHTPTLEMFGEGSVDVPYPPVPERPHEERAEDNDGWWEHGIETTGMVSPDVDDEPPPVDAIYAPLMVNDVSDEPVIVEDDDDDVRF
jgi:hypothetical protein